MRSEGFWISPAGDIIQVSIHMLAITADPELFGFTTEQLKNMFSQYNEPYGQEGNAREIIFKDVYRRGWIRVREYYGKMGEKVSIQTGNIGDREMNRIQVFADKYVKKEIPSALGKYAEAAVMDLKGYNETFTMQEIADFAMFKKESEEEIRGMREESLERAKNIRFYTIRQYEECLGEIRQRVFEALTQDTRKVIRRMI
jgi:hypothetical protein